MSPTLPGQFDRRRVRANAPPSARQAHAGELTKRLAEPLIGGNLVALLEDRPQTLDAMCRAIEGARDHINIESTLVEADGPGEAIAPRLEQRCGAGVRVNLLFDSAGSPRSASAVIERLRRSGVNLCEHNPVAPWRNVMGLSMRPRDHCRLMVVDGRLALIGGDMGPVHVQIDGPAVQRLQRLFIARWQCHAHTPMQPARYFRPLAPAGTQRVGIAAGDAARRRDPYESALLGAIDTARQRVLLTTPGLAPPRRLLRKLVQAAERGVGVELLVPGRSPGWPALLASGVRIHERHDAPRHAGACVIDGVWSGIGASNAGWRNLLAHAGAKLVVLDEAFGARLEQLFRRDAARAVEIDLAAWQRRSLWQRLRESLARF